MELDKIILRLFQVVAKDLRHKHYAYTVAKHKEYMALVAGVGLDDYLKQYVRREDAELFKQRKELTNHIVTAVSKNLLDPFYKVPRSNSGRRILNYVGEDTREGKIKEVEGILAKFWGVESWDDYMGTRFTELNSVDPNSFTVFEFKDFDNETELVQPYPYEVSSVMAVDYKKINKVLEYLIAKDDHSYKIPQIINKTDQLNSSELPDDKKLFKSGHKYTLYTKNAVIQLLQVHANEEDGLNNLSEGKPIVLGAERREYVKLGKLFYEVKRPAAHNCERVTAVQIGYLRDLATNGETFVSPIHPAIPYLKKTIKVNSELDLVATLLAMPQQVKYTDVCKAENCYNGTNSVSNKPCGVCHGSGLKPTAPSSQDAIAFKMPESKEQMIPLDQIITYIRPPVDIVKWQEDYVEKLTVKCTRIMYNSDIFTRKQIADTATGKTIDMQNVYDTLHPFAVKFGKTWTAGAQIMAKLADRADKLVASYTFGKDFKLKTLDSLIMDLSITNGIGSPGLVRHLNYDIAQIIFSEKPMELQRYKLKEMFNPFSGKSEKEIMLLMAGDLISRRDKVLHANYGRIFDELEIEHAKAKKDFYQLKRLAQREAIYKKVDEIIIELDGDKPEPDLGD